MVRERSLEDLGINSSNSSPMAENKSVLLSSKRQTYSARICHAPKSNIDPMY